MSSKALAIWRILARNYSSGYWVDPAKTNENNDIGVNIISGKENSATEATRILEELSNQNLILQHLGWVWLLIYKMEVAKWVGWAGWVTLVSAHSQVFSF